MFFQAKTNILLFFAFSIILFSAVNASAAVLTVTTLADTDDTVCDAHCSLREAVDASVGGDTIIFARDLRGGTIQLTRTLLIQRRMFIDGPNRRRITVKGDNTFRLIETRTDGTSSMVISIDGLIMRDGYAEGDGGGILTNGSPVINLTNCALLNNTAQRGGGIYMLGGTLYLIDSTLANNRATAEGSAGGIDIRYTTVRIINSTISGNQSLSATDGIGGIRLYNSPTWFIHNSTVVNNSTNGTSAVSIGGVGQSGGTSGSIVNSVVARNTGVLPDLFGNGFSVRNSFVGIANPSGSVVNGAHGNIAGTPENPLDPQIGELTDNGGGLPTHALLPASRAIDAGNNSLAVDRRGEPLTVDQRGFSRIVNLTVDISAYEFNAAPQVVASVITGQLKIAGSRGASGARVLLRDKTGETRYAITNPFGFYRFTNVPADAVYQIEAHDKRDTFAPQTVLVEESVEHVYFQAN